MGLNLFLPFPIKSIDSDKQQQCYYMKYVEKKMMLLVKAQAFKATKSVGALAMKASFFGDRPYLSFQYPPMASLQIHHFSSFTQKLLMHPPNTHTPNHHLQTHPPHIDMSDGYIVEVNT